MINGKSILYTLACMLLLFTACSETKEEPGLFSDWKKRNIDFVNEISTSYESGTDPNLKAITAETNPELGRQIELYYRKYGNFYTDADSQWDEAYFPEGVETRLDRSPIYTDKVLVFYRGMLMTDEGVLEELPIENFITSGYNRLVNFDSNFSKYHSAPQIDKDFNRLSSSNQDRFLMTVGETVPGFATMLQFMKPGDRVEVIIPYKYGYGDGSKGSIPGYSTLIFDLTLIDIED